MPSHSLKNRHFGKTGHIFLAEHDVTCPSAALLSFSVNPSEVFFCLSVLPQHSGSQGKKNCCPAPPLPSLPLQPGHIVGTGGTASLMEPPQPPQAQSSALICPLILSPWDSTHTRSAGLWGQAERENFFTISEQEDALTTAGVSKSGQYVVAKLLEYDTSALWNSFFI